MDYPLKKNGLCLKKVISKLDHGNILFGEFDLDKLTKQHFSEQPAYGVFYLDYKIAFALWDGNKWSYETDKKEPDLDFLQTARIFNPTQELKLWRDEPDVVFWRYRQDAEHTEDGAQYCVDARQALWGTRAESSKDGNWTKLFEERGTEICVPIAGVEHIEGQANPLVQILTRNYLEAHSETGQMSYRDVRFLAIEKYKVED